MTTKTDIANQALILLESDPVTDIDQDEADTAVTLRALFEMSRRFVLRDNDFNFSRAQTVLTADPDAPAYKDAHQGELTAFRLPDDQIRILRVSLDEYPLTYWQVVGRWIYCSASSITVTYTKDTPLGLWDAAAVEVLSYYLAWKAAMPITKSKDVKGDMLDGYTLARDTAKVSSGLEGTSPKLRSEGRLTSVRHSSQYQRYN